MHILSVLKWFAISTELNRDRDAIMHGADSLQLSAHRTMKFFQVQRKSLCRLHSTEQFSSNDRLANGLIHQLARGVMAPGING